ncbi:Uncharacterized protein GGF32_009689, partial [Allomyces javanicus]
ALIADVYGHLAAAANQNGMLLVQLKHALGAHPAFATHWLRDTVLSAPLFLTIHEGGLMPSIVTSGAMRDANYVRVQALASQSPIALAVQLSVGPDRAEIDVVQLGVFDAAAKTVRVCLFDFARGTHRSSMTTVLNEILTQRPVVVHDGRAAVAALKERLGVMVLPEYDLQTLFVEWTDLAAQAVALYYSLVAHGAPAKSHLLDSQVHRLAADMNGPRPDLNIILAACGLPPKFRKTKPRGLLDSGAPISGATACRTLWQCHTPESDLDQWAAYEVWWLGEAAATMHRPIAALSAWISRSLSWLNATEKCRPISWSLANSLPRRVPVHAWFDGNKRLVWRVATSPTSVAAPGGDDNSTAVVAAMAASEFTQHTKDEVEELFLLLPSNVHAILASKYPHAVTELDEIVLDVGRAPKLRFFRRPVHEREVELTDLPDVTTDDLAAICDGRNWMGDRDGNKVGLTIRVGRACPPGHGLGQTLEDVIASSESVLLLGKPGSGKTHTLRDLCARMSDTGHNVVVVDTSNELGGPGTIPHFSLHRARRMQVPRRDSQSEVLLEAISDRREVAAARSVVTRIQRMVATAHGSLQSVLRNRDLRDLVGGLVTATVGDENARSMGGRKTITQRANDATFTTVVELVSRTEVHVFRDVNQTVDDLLAHPKCTLWIGRRWLPDASGAPRGYFWVAREPYEGGKTDFTV